MRSVHAAQSMQPKFTPTNISVRNVVEGNLF
jgi:hypothetical protein